MAENQSKLLSYMSNPRSFTLKKWFATLLKNKYTVEHDLTVERISSSLATENDVEKFGKLMGQLFESGYQRAVDDITKQLEGHGFRIDLQTIKVDPNEEIS